MNIEVEPGEQIFDYILRALKELNASGEPIAFLKHNDVVFSIRRHSDPHDAAMLWDQKRLITRYKARYGDIEST